MKLVVEIPDGYDVSMIQNGSIASKIILNAVSNATPLEKVLEDIKAEIEHELNRNTSGNEMFGKGLRCGYGECIAIIDSHISGEEQE